MINIGTYFATRLVTKNFAKLTEKLNILPEKRHFIAMKNEFLIDRIILTSRKKWYAYAALAQEGKIFSVPDIKIVGIAFKKSTVTKSVRKYFENLIKEDMLTGEIDIIKLLKRLESFQEWIRTEVLEEGSLEYGKTERVNPKSGYKFPYRIGAFRGALIWNALYPSNSIQFGEKCRTYKCNINSIEDIEGLKETNKFVYETIVKNIFENKEMKEYGLSIIGIPFGVDRLPEWILPYVDVDEIVEDNLRLIYPLIESLGITISTIRSSDYYTNLLPTKLWI